MATTMAALQIALVNPPDPTVFDILLAFNWPFLDLDIHGTACCSLTFLSRLGIYFEVRF